MPIEFCCLSIQHHTASRFLQNETIQIHLRLHAQDTITLSVSLALFVRGSMNFFLYLIAESEVVNVMHLLKRIAPASGA